MRKEKLTLSVDEEVVKKARALDINISQATEMALRGFTAGSGEADANQIRAAYDYLFRAMMPTMLLLGTTVEVVSGNATSRLGVRKWPPDHA